MTKHDKESGSDPLHPCITVHGSCSRTGIPRAAEFMGAIKVKSPKLYFTDSGLACHLLGIETEEALCRSPFLGPIFEGFILNSAVGCGAAAAKGNRYE